MSKTYDAPKYSDVGTERPYFTINKRNLASSQLPQSFQEPHGQLQTDLE